MARVIKLWRTFESVDSANSDQWHARKADALAHLSKMYDVPRRALKLILTQSGHKSWKAVSPTGSWEVFLDEYELRTTREELAWAFTNLPIR